MNSARTGLGNPTLLLWVANGIALLLLLALVVYRLGPLLPGASGPMAEIRPLTQAEVAEPPASPVTEITRNPFDPAGSPWRLSASTTDDKPAAGAVKGVMILPGVKAVITDGATVRFGETLAGGTIIGVDRQQLLLEGPGGRTRIDLPGAQRPHLKDLNRSDAPACKDAKC